MNSHQDEIRRGVAALLPRLRRFGAALAGTADDGDDIVQGAIERALAKPEHWQDGVKLDQWLFGIMQHFWRDELRKRRNDTKAKNLANGTPAESSVDGRRITETMLMLAKTRERFARLPDEQRLALALVVIDGRSYQEAAEHLEIPIGTLMSRLSRAREALRMMTEADDMKIETAVGAK